MKVPRSYLKVFLWVVVVAAGTVRLLGITRGTSDWEDPPRFHHFHPDEDRLVRAALDLDNPFAPPLSSYGPVSHYALRGVVELVSLFWHDPAPGFSSTAGTWRLFVIARLLAIVVSMLGLWFLYRLASQHCGEVGAVVAVCFLSFAPLAIQQAHFYAIDGIFATASLGALWAVSVALRSEDWRPYALAGAMIGIAGGVRLVGIGLGAALVVAWIGIGIHRSRSDEAGKGRVHIPLGHMLLAVGAAAATLLLLAPYLLTSALSMVGAGWDPGTQLDLAGHTPSTLSQLRANAVGVARGTILRPWSLIDIHTVPYLHQLTDLWPQAVGWPLAITFYAAVLWSAYNLNRRRAVLLIWSGLYFAVIGALHTKHVRYLLPLLPILSLFAADLCVWIKSKHRLTGVFLVGSLIGVTAAFGLGFARIYAVEDSRLQASRWMAENVSLGSKIGVEGGAFSLSSVISDQDFPKIHLEISELFRARGYTMCAPVLSLLQAKVAGLEYIVVTDVNRYRQFRAVPEMFPVVAEFYDRLLQERLGFRVARTIRVYPSLAGILLRDDDAEPAFVGFDHPTTWILRREGTAAGSWEEWRKDLDDNDHCADGLLRRAASAFKQRRWQVSLKASEQVLSRFPEMKVARLIQAAAHRQLGQANQARTALAIYRSPYRLDAGAQGPWATGASLVELNLTELVAWMR